MKKKIVASLLVAAMAVSMLAGCGDNKDANTSKEDNSKKEQQEETQKSDGNNSDDDSNAGEEQASGEDVTIKLFSNLPDRKNGQGLVEQTIIDEYMEANQNVTIEVEALDEEAYKTKFKAY